MSPPERDSDCRVDGNHASTSQNGPTVLHMLSPFRLISPVQCIQTVPSSDRLSILALGVPGLLACAICHRRQRIYPPLEADNVLVVNLEVDVARC